MRKIVSGFACSLDGYIEGPAGEYDWILMDKDIDFAAQMKRFDTFFIGRRTYESILPMGSKPVQGITNYAFSNTLQSVNENYRLIRGDVLEQVMQIRNQPGKDIAVFGGAGLLASLLDLGVVDEISISFIPVLLGKGKPMVAVLREKIWLTYLNSRTYSNGTVQITYSVNRS